VSDGQTLWIYDPTAREVQEFPVGQGFLSGSAVQFLLGEGLLLRDFTVRAQQCPSETVRLLLTPKQDATYEVLELLVVADPA
jgi:outer membrane lipoprotein-sorting protein